MKKTYQYKVIEHKDKLVFQDKVVEYMEDGWKLQGGIFFDSLGFYYQAVYKEEIYA